MEQVISKILSILEECDQAIEIAQLVLFAVITKKCSNVSKAVKTCDVASSNVIDVASSDTSSDVKSVKPIERIEKLAAQDIQLGIELYLSDVDRSSMTDVQKRRYDLAVAYFGGSNEST